MSSRLVGDVQQLIEELKLEDLTHAQELVEASKLGDLVKVQQLLREENSDVNRPDASGNNPLFMASQCNRIQIVKLLLTRPKINVNQSRHGLTSLEVASQRNYTTVVELLLQRSQIKVSIVNWGYWKVRMLHIIYDPSNSIKKTAKELTCLNNIYSFDTTFKLELARHSILYPDLTNIIYEFARPDLFVQIMDMMNVN